MKKILVIGLGHLSTGEITIAAEMLREGAGKNFELLFVSHAQGKLYASSMGFPVRALNHSDSKENRKEFERIIQEWNPDVLFCADIYTMDFSTSWSGIDFEYLKELGLPLGTLDSFEWESTSFEWDLLGAKPIQMEEMLIKECDFLIRPCPLNKPRPNDSRICTCPLFSTPVQPPISTYDKWREQIGIAKDHKVVFIVNSAWEYVGMSKLLRVQNFIHWMPQIIYQYFSDIDVPLTIIHLGPHKWDFPMNDLVQYVFFRSMKSQPALYYDTLYHADMFCGSNITSTTLSIAIYYQTPSILFQNHKKIDFAVLNPILPKMPKWYQKMANDVLMVEPFRMFPWGWYHLLNPILENNPYNECFLSVPVMEPKKVKRTIKQYLTDQPSIQKLKDQQDHYFKTINNLEPVQSFLGKWGRT